MSEKPAEVVTLPPPLTAARLRSLATRHGLFAGSLIVLRLADGTRLRLADDSASAPWEIDEATGKPRLTGPPVLTLTFEKA